VSSVEKAAGYAVIRIPVGWIGERHPSPHRQIAFSLSGALKVTASDGTVRTVTAGNVWLMEDTQGRGHESEVASDVPFEAVVILLSH
jgi:quercetin dioxygenase-like cupin family protein